MNYNNPNTNAFLIHISAFAGYFFPFGNIIAPLIAWQTLKNRSQFLDLHGKEAINFNISITLYFLLFVSTGIFSGLFTNFSFIAWNTAMLGIFAYFVGTALIIIASLKAKEGHLYSYPITIKFLK